ncbi:unnamed protein product [Boreogadus saida]
MLVAGRRGKELTSIVRGTQTYTVCSMCTGYCVYILHVLTSPEDTRLNPGTSCALVSIRTVCCDYHDIYTQTVLTKGVSCCRAAHTAKNSSWLWEHWKEEPDRMEPVQANTCALLFRASTGNLSQQAQQELGRRACPTLLHLQRRSNGHECVRSFPSLKEHFNIPLKDHLTTPLQAHNDLATSQPANNDLATPQLANNDLATSQPANNDLATSQPANNDLATSQLANNDLATSQPANNDLATAQPINHHLAMTPISQRSPDT